jgi:hypothetical protein
MKINRLGIIFSETKANKNRFAPESVQFSPGWLLAVDHQTGFGIGMIRINLQEVA